MKKIFLISLLGSALLFSSNIFAGSFYSFTPPATSGIVYIMIQPVMDGEDSYEIGTKSYQKVKYGVNWGGAKWNKTGYWDGQKMRADLDDCLILEMVHKYDDSVPMTIYTNASYVTAWQGSRSKDGEIYSLCHNTRYIEWGK